MKGLKMFLSEKKFKIMLIVIAVIFGAAIMGNKNVYAAQASITTDGTTITWEYSVQNNEATLVKIITLLSSNTTNGPYDVVVPSSIDGYTVTALGDGTNKILEKTNSWEEDRIYKLVIPATVKNINAHAFEDVVSLTGIEFQSNSSLETIGDYAFRNNIRLQAIWTGTVENGCLSFPSTLKTIGKYAFEMNPRLQHYKIEGEEVVPYRKTNGWAYYTHGVANFNKVRFSESLTNIDDYAFAGCSVLTNAVIPNTTSNLRIGKAAFSYCNLSNLGFSNRQTTLNIDDFAFSYQHTSNETLNLPDNIVLGTYVFKENKQLKNVTVGNVVLGENTFEDDIALETITLSNSVKVLPSRIFQRCTNLETVTAPGVTVIETEVFKGCNHLANLSFGSLKYIGNYAFRDCSSLTTEMFNQLVPSTNAIALGSGTFMNCTGITDNITIKLSMNTVTEGGKDYIPSATWAFNNTRIKKMTITTDENLTDLPSGIFESCSLLEDVDLPSSIINIGSSAFKNCNNISLNVLENKIINNVVSIGEYAFYGDTGLAGNLTLPQSLKQINHYAFANTNIENINYNTTLETIGTMALPENNEVIRIPSTHLNTISKNAFSNVREAFFEVESIENLAEKWNGNNDVIIHYKNHKHTVKLYNSLPGVRLINNDTNEEITTAELACESNVNLKVEVQEGYSYPDLAVKIISGGQYASSELTKEFATLDSNGQFTLSNLTRDKVIVLQKDRNQTDLELRQFITSINGRTVETSRAPNIITTRNVWNLDEIEYQHIKLPLTVRKGDTITYTIRVYNEGDCVGKVNELRAYLQDGLELVESNTVNWIVESTTDKGTIIKTNYLQDKDITTYRGEGKPEYQDVELTCKVTKEETDLLTVIAELSDSNDVDSIAKNVSLNQLANYKKDESYTSYETSYIKSAEDDTDYESVAIRNVYRVGYKIALEKIDSTNSELLNGAKFNLYNANKELIESQVTVNDGYLEFNEQISFGEGTDTYFIEEVETPAGYRKTIDGLMELTVRKFISVDGTVGLEIICDVDERYDFKEEDDFYIPITNANELKKIGTGEAVVINGESHLCTANAFYELKNDIDIGGSEWTPIPEFSGVLEGNGYKIKNLTIHKNIEYSYDNTYYFGLFANMSGYIRNVTLDNVDIQLTLDAEQNDQLISNYNSQIDALNEQKAEIAERYTQERQAQYLRYKSGEITYSQYTSLRNEINQRENEEKTPINNQIDAINAQINQVKNNNYYAGNTNNYNNMRIGGFAGYTNGVAIFENCTVNGTIKTGVTNVGGFIGHAIEGRDLKLKNCTNNANVSGADNIGGLVGCSKSSTDLINCTNNGKITSTAYNAGGLIGVAVPEGATPENIVVGYNEATATITIAVKNKKTVTGQYSLFLEKIDRKAETYLNGAKFNVYDEEMNLLYENAVAENGQLKITDIVINSLKTDVFYIKEVQAPEGYEIKVKDFVKVVVKKTWNSQKEEYEINVEPSIATGITETANNGIESSTGAFSDFVGSSYVRYKYGESRVKASDCINNGEVISTSKGSSAGGIVGLIKGTANINNCKNLGKIKSKAHTGGIIGQLYDEPDKESRIRNSINGDKDDTQGQYGILEVDKIVNNNNEVVEDGSGLAGIVGTSKAELLITNCYNYSNLKGGNALSGIIGNSLGRTLTISDCYNYGNLEKQDGSDCAVGGILGAFYGKYATNSFSLQTLGQADTQSDLASLTIKNSYSDGNISGAESDHIGGILGYGLTQTENEFISIKNCEVGNDNKLVTLTSTASSSSDGTSGGIVGQLFAPKMDIVFNNVKNVKLNGASGLSGGVIGQIAQTYPANYTGNINLNVTNNNIYSVEITSGVSAGGLIAAVCYPNKDFYGSSTSKGNAEILDNVVRETRVAKEESSSGESAKGGLIGKFATHLDTNIKRCKVINTDVIEMSQSGDSNISGFIGGATANSLNIEDCEIKSIDNNNHYIKGVDGDNTCVVGGVIGYLYNANTLQIKNTKISDMKIEEAYNMNSGDLSIGGVIGHLNSSATLSGIEVNNVDISKQEKQDATSRSMYGGIGGFIGGNVSGEQINISNSKFTNSTITSEGEGIVGGICGSIGSLKANISGVNIENIKIKTNDTNYTYQGSTSNDPTIGGIIGYTGKLFSIANTNVKDIEIETKNSVGKSVGGLVGCGNGEFSSVKVNNLKMNCDFKDNATTRSVGGLLGTTTTLGNLSIDNVTAEDVEIKSDYANVGGFVGYIDNKTTTINNNSSIKNALLELTAEPPQSAMGSHAGCFGGLIGAITGSNDVNITPILENVEIKIPFGIGNMYNYSIPQAWVASRDPHAGGVVGYAYKVNINGGKLDNVKLTNSSLAGCVGGIIGANESSGTINNTIASNLILNGQHRVGGIYGFGNANISGVTVENVDVLTDEFTLNNDKVLDMQVGGIAGISLGNITNATVTSTDDETHTLKSKYYCGGIAGFCSGLISNSIVENIIISSMNNVQEVEQNISGGEAGDNGVLNTVASYVSPLAALFNSEPTGCTIHNIILKQIINGLEVVETIE